ncbi:3-phosphoshikimate 1-carboxyvinyltransferase [Sulfodiicoccus acidiphilus]|uniref:3-phosphoshikimate 1-carboxyvinyltransferase n=1 Tax=Sulfodiicoccus acidiphilus TaxID=1670455 RepID=UPI001E5DEC6D|nr:3-phosphoshikimate 1-carboxyvinyltransferase [Sulfodiicoccus acidiphilus]
MRICRAKAEGRLKAPPSKPLGIRLIFASLLTDVHLSELPSSEDFYAALDAVKSLGVSVEGNSLLRPTAIHLKTNYLNLRGSATSLRFIIPIVALVGGRVTLDGDESLRRRPLYDIIPQLTRMGVKVSSNSLPLTIEGGIGDNEFHLSELKSSQYISGFIYALALRGGGSVEFPPNLGSMSYVRLTAEVLNSVGAKVRVEPGRVEIERGPTTSFRGPIAGDYLLSSFYAAAAILTGGEVEIGGLLSPASYFGDHSIVDLFSEMGASSYFNYGRWKVAAGDLRGIKVDVDDAPDLAPSLAAVAVAADGETVLTGVERLRFKESDRVSTIVSTVDAFGAVARGVNDEIRIIGTRKLRRTEIQCPNDHRIAMMAGAVGAASGVLIEKAECVNKSNPKFWEDLSKLGVKVELL